LTSFRRGEGSPEAFYLKLGFLPTGQELHGEVELGLELSAGGLTRDPGKTAS
jgi:hypothetical protein